MGMQRRIMLLFGALICFNSITAETHWTRITSPNFELYTTAGERSARDTLRFFEQVHDFFAQNISPGSDKAPPVRIVAFNSMKEYEPYRINEIAVAYYQATADH